jgi:hypothetical protein
VAGRLDRADGDRHRAHRGRPTATERYLVHEHGAAERVSQPGGRRLSIGHAHAPADRVRLSPGAVRDPQRDAHPGAHPHGGHAGADGQLDANAHEQANGDPDEVADAAPDGHADPYSDPAAAHAAADTDADTSPNPDADTRTHADTDPGADADADTRAHAHTDPRSDADADGMTVAVDATAATLKGPDRTRRRRRGSSRGLTGRNRRRWPVPAGDPKAADVACYNPGALSGRG